MLLAFLSFVISQFAAYYSPQLEFLEDIGHHLHPENVGFCSVAFSVLIHALIILLLENSTPTSYP
jgi:hypothetical protein